MNIFIIIVVCLVWLLGAYISWNKYFKTWTDRGKGERLWFAAVWPLCGILYIIRNIEIKIHDLFS